jgi:hypothetical protein
MYWQRYMSHPVAQTLSYDPTEYWIVNYAETKRYMLLDKFLLLNQLSEKRVTLYFYSQIIYSLESEEEKMYADAQICTLNYL